MLAFAHIEKTGGQTLCNILRQSFPGRHCDFHFPITATAEDLGFVRRFYPNLSSIRGHCIKPHSDLEHADDGLQFFTLLREPIARCLSHYQFMVVKNGLSLDFETWLAQSGHNHQTRFISGTDDADAAIDILERKVGFVGIVEQFNASLVMLRAWAQRAQLIIRYRSRNIAQENSIKRRINADVRLKQMAINLNQQDIKLYRYVRDVIFARQVAQYGPTLDAEVRALEASLPAPRRPSLSIDVGER